MITRWSTTPGLDFLKAWMLLKAHVAGSGNLSLELWYQTAKLRTDAPDAWARVNLVGGGSAISIVGDDEDCSGVVDISALTSGKMFIRFAVGYFTSSAGNAASGDVSYGISLAQCGQMVGNWAGELSTLTTSPQRQIVTGWLPALLAEEVKAGFILTTLVGNFQCRLAYRTATTMRDVASGWTPLGTNLTSSDILADTAVSGASEMWVQFAIEYSLSSGSNLGSAHVSVAVGTRRT